MDLRWKVERFLRQSGTSATTFGRRAVRDPRFVHDLRRGREPGPRITARVEAYLAVAGKMSANRGG